MKSLILVVLFVGCYTMVATTQSRKTVNNKPVDTLDMKKYVGLWYEIARFDHSFEKGLVGVTTEYVIKPDGNIEVIGTGFQDSLSGERKEVVGKAHIPDSKRPGVIQVTFLLFFKTNYHILNVEEDYSAALIGSSEEDHLWILSRTPSLPEKKLKDLLQHARERGYDTSALVYIPHVKKLKREEFSKF